jgi:hypothetical protein
MSVYQPFCKTAAIASVDEGKHTVTGVSCSEAIDADNEICSYPEQVQQYRAWSDSQFAATTAAGIGPSKGNVRVNHDPHRLGGVVTDIEYRDVPREVWLTTRVLPDVWPLVESAALTSYSQAGSYVRRWHKACGTEIPRGNACPTCGLQNAPIHYVARLAEVSLCDRGSNPDATIRYIKSNGSSELRKFATPTAVEMPAWWEDQELWHDNGTIMMPGDIGDDLTGFEDIELGEGIALASLPPAATTYILPREYSGDDTGFE